MTSGWTEGKPWEIAWGEFGRKERYGSDERVDGEKPWEIAWGELLWEGAIRKRRVGGRTGNRGKYSMGRAPLGRSDTEATKRWTERKPWEIAGESSGEAAIRKRREGGRKGNHGK